MKDALPTEIPDWMRAGLLYELNVRQFTPEGTLAAATKSLEPLAALGVTGVCLLPVHPIGQAHREGALGSPFAVRDHREVRTELGGSDELRAFVDAAHQHGIAVLLDWVAHQTAVDHPWVADHPEWFHLDRGGRPLPGRGGRNLSVHELDLSQDDVRSALIEAMEWWRREVGVDGFRGCETAAVPADFWREAHAALNESHPTVLLLGRTSSTSHETRADVLPTSLPTTAASWQRLLVAIALGRADAMDLSHWLAVQGRAWPAGSPRIHWVSDHATNALEGTAEEQLGPALPLGLALSFLTGGIPLLHNGDEVGSPKRLSLHERDPIDWEEGLLPLEDWIAGLARLRRAHPALHTGHSAERVVLVRHDQPTRGLAILRSAPEEEVLVLANLSGKGLALRVGESELEGEWMEVWGPAGPTAKELHLTCEAPLGLMAWGIRVLSRSRSV